MKLLIHAIRPPAAVLLVIVELVPQTMCIYNIMVAKVEARKHAAPRERQEHRPSQMHDLRRTSELGKRQQFHQLRRKRYVQSILVAVKMTKINQNIWIDRWHDWDQTLIKTICSCEAVSNHIGQMKGIHIQLVCMDPKPLPTQRTVLCNSPRVSKRSRPISSIQL